MNATLGMLTYRVDRSDWYLSLSTGHAGIVAGPDPRDPVISPVQVLASLGEAIKPLVERERVTDVHIAVRRNDGSSIGTLIVKDGVIAPVLGKNGGQGAPT